MLTDAIALEVEQKMKSIVGKTHHVQYQTKHSLFKIKNPTLTGFKKKCQRKVTSKSVDGYIIGECLCVKNEAELIYSSKGCLEC